MRQTIRALLRAPGFAITSVVTLALGIGLSVAVYTVASGLLLRRLPMRDQDRLVALWGEKRDGSAPHWPLSIEQVREFLGRTRSLSVVAYADYYGALPASVVDGENVTRVRGALVSGNYFGVLGARPLVGRMLQPSDDAIGAAPVAVISRGMWERRFGLAPDVVGRRITLQVDGTSYAIVGVAPAGLAYPQGADFWAPFTPTRLRTAKDSSFAELDLIGRLAPGATATNAQSELSSYYAADPSPWARALRGVARPLPRVIFGDARTATLLFAAAAALLLVITCINVANLLLVRGLVRIREMAIRAALGASRARIAAQLLGENAVLAVAGGTFGIAIAAVTVGLFRTFAPASIPLLDRVRLDASALVGALAISALAMLLFGLGPAVAGMRVDLQRVLRSGTGQSASRTSQIVRESLVVAQVSLAVLMLSAAALIGRSFMKLENAGLAFDSSHLLIVELGVRGDRYRTLDAQVTMLRDLLARLRRTPGVNGASPVVAVPFSGTGGWTGRGGVEGQSPDVAAKNPTFDMELVTPDYFPTFSLRVLRGRTLRDDDREGAERVVVISAAVAREYWPDEDPLGKRLVMGGGLDQAFTVVGVVPDTRYRELRDAGGSVYFALAQSIFPFAPLTLAIRTTGAPAALVPLLRRVIPDAAADAAVASAAPFESYLETPLGQPRLDALLLAVFAIAATALAAVGLFSVMATMVRQRRRELGIRMALGASARAIESMVVVRGVAVAVAGVAVGLVAAIAADRVFASLLYQTSPTDAAVLGTVAGLSVATAAVASFLPARMSARIDPVIALRAEG